MGVRSLILLGFGSLVRGAAFLVAALLFGLAATGCNYRVDKQASGHTRMGDQEKAQLSYRQVYERVFAPKCVSCHGSQGGVNLESYESTKSSLGAIERVVFTTKSMPKGGSLSADEEQILRVWIEIGAPKDPSGPRGEPQPTPPPSPKPSPSPSPTPGPWNPNDLSYEFVNQEVLKPRCLVCHGSGASIGLETYSLVKSRMRDIIRAVLVEKSMPKNAALSKREYDILLTWIANGAPELPDTEPKPTPGPTATPSPTPTPAPLEPTFDSIKKNILTVRCIACHSGTGPAKHIPMQTREDLVDSPREIVIPGNPDESGIVLAIERTDSKRMPPPDAGAALSQKEKDVIRKWIQDGATK